MQEYVFSKVLTYIDFSQKSVVMITVKILKSTNGNHCIT